MTNLVTVSIIARIHDIRIRTIVALICWPLCAGIAMADDNGEMNVVVTRQGIEIEGAVLPSIKSFESYLEKIPRTRPVVVGIESAAEIEMFMRVYEMLSSLGFEDVRTAGEDDPTWSLYPPMPVSEAQRVESISEGPVDGENDS